VSGEDPQRLTTLVQSQLSRWCFPRLNRDKETGGWERAYGFSSLLGALWLQMFFLMTTRQDDVRRCAWCNGPVSSPVPDETPEERIARPSAGIRKPHKTNSNKKTCSDACRKAASLARQRARQES
jgi:hypothetical protein